MSTMVCDICGKYGIYWRTLDPPSTYCPHCKQINCQIPEGSPSEEDECFMPSIYVEDSRLFPGVVHVEDAKISSNPEAETTEEI